MTPASAPPFGAALRTLRRRRGVTQTELGAALGLDQSVVSRLETRGVPQIDTLARYVVALGGKLELIVRFPDGRSYALRVPDVQVADASASASEVNLILDEEEEPK